MHPASTSFSARSHKADRTTQGAIATCDLRRLRPDAHKPRIAYQQHQEDVDEGLSAWKAVRIVESMPDKIQHIHGKACKKEQQQSAVHSLFFHTRSSCMPDIAEKREAPPRRSKISASGPDRSPSPHFRYGGRSCRRSRNRKSTPFWEIQRLPDAVLWSAQISGSRTRCRKSAGQAGNILQISIR